MLNSVFRYLLSVNGINAGALIVALVAMWRLGRTRASWVWWTVALLALLFVARTIYFSQTGERWCYDLRHLWLAGSYALEDKDPYTVKGLIGPPNQDLVTFFYPPSALPLFKLLALAPLSVAKVAWTVTNVLICLALGMMARQALIAQDGDNAAPMRSGTAALLATPVIFSMSAHFSLEAGQVSLLVTFALLGALTAQGHQPSRSAVTAAFLAIASIKPQTMVPFMLLFMRRRDLKTWLFLCIFLAALLLAAVSPTDLPTRIASMLDANAAARAPGKISDFSLLNRYTNTMFGFEHLFACIGLADHGTVATLGLTCSLVMGAWLAYVINVQQTLARGACCSLVSLYSMLFFYHRVYDLSILIIPLFYCAIHFQAAPRRTRWCYAWVMAAVLLALNAQYGLFWDIRAEYPSSAILRILVLPSVTYLILSAIAALTAGAYFEARFRSIPSYLTDRRQVSLVAIK
jgi:hypothetical protein